MPNHKGSEGVVYIGATAIAEVVDWNFDETMAPIKTSTLNTIANTYVSGATDASGTITCHWDETDTAGQGVMIIGAEVTLNLYPEGNESGDNFWTGTVLITSISRAANGQEGIVGATYNWKANGEMTPDMVS